MMGEWGGRQGEASMMGEWGGRQGELVVETVPEGLAATKPVYAGWDSGETARDDVRHDILCLADCEREGARSG